MTKLNRYNISVPCWHIGDHQGKPMTIDNLMCLLADWDCGWHGDFDAKGLSELPSDQFEEREVYTFGLGFPHKESYECDYGKLRNMALLTPAQILWKYMERKLIPVDPYTLVRANAEYDFIGPDYVSNFTIWIDKQGRCWRMQFGRGYHEGGPHSYVNIALTPNWTRAILGDKCLFMGFPIR